MWNLPTRDLWYSSQYEAWMDSSSLTCQRLSLSQNLHCIWGHVYSHLNLDLNFAVDYVITWQTFTPCPPQLPPMSLHGEVHLSALQMVDSVFDLLCLRGYCYMRHKQGLEMCLCSWTHSHTSDRKRKCHDQYGDLRRVKKTQRGNMDPVCRLKSSPAVLRQDQSNSNRCREIKDSF